MPTAVKITRHPLDGHPYQIGKVVTLPDPRAAKLLATGCATLTGGSPSPQLAMFIDCFRSASPSAPKPKWAAKLPEVEIRLTSPAKLDGRTRAAGSTVSLSEGRAARLIASGQAEMPGKPSPRLTAMVAEFRRAAPLLEVRGVQFATAF